MNGPIPPAQAEYIVWQTLATILDRLIEDPVEVVEVDYEGRKIDTLPTVDADTLKNAARRIQAEVDLRAQNMFQTQEETLLLRQMQARVN